MNLKQTATSVGLFLGALLLAGVAAPPAARAADDAPKDAAKVAKRWTLEFAHSHLKRAVVGERTYYYMTLTVTNKTGLPRPWHPVVIAHTDTTHPVYVAGGFAPALEEIRRVEDNPALVPVEASGWKNDASGKIQDGETKALAAIFGPIDAQWSHFRIEVLGLINPSATLKVQKYGEGKWTVSDTVYLERNEKVLADLRAEAQKTGGAMPTPTPEYHEVVESRAKVIEYYRSGDEFRPDDDPIQFVRERWEVLGEPQVIRVIPSRV